MCRLSPPPNATDLLSSWTSPPWLAVPNAAVWIVHTLNNSVLICCMWPWMRSPFLVNSYTMLVLLLCHLWYSKMAASNQPVSLSKRHVAQVVCSGCTSYLNCFLLRGWSWVYTRWAYYSLGWCLPCITDLNYTRVGETYGISTRKGFCCHLISNNFKMQ